jgi:hypothetical protein
MAWMLLPWAVGAATLLIGRSDTKIDVASPVSKPLGVVVAEPQQQLPRRGSSSRRDYSCWVESQRHWHFGQERGQGLCLHDDFRVLL